MVHSKEVVAKIELIDKAIEYIATSMVMIVLVLFGLFI